MLRLQDLNEFLPDAHIEEVGRRRELVIYTGLSQASYDPETGEWTELDHLVPFPEELD